MKKLASLLPALLLAGCAASRADVICFDSTADNAPSSPWANHHYAFSIPSASSPLGGRMFRRLEGVGWNEAQTPSGFVDMVPVSGSAVHEGNTWTVSIVGTLWQESQPDLGPPEESQLYYIISEVWKLDDRTLNGKKLVGNLHKPFVEKRFPFAEDDAGLGTVRRVDCASQFTGLPPAP